MTMITMIISLHCDTDNHDNDDIEDTDDITEMIILKHL